jgi:hypothetical protein
MSANGAAAIVRDCSETGGDVLRIAFPARRDRAPAGHAFTARAGAIAFLIRRRRVSGDFAASMSRRRMIDRTHLAGRDPSSPRLKSQSSPCCAGGRRGEGGDGADMGCRRSSSLARVSRRDEVTDLYDVRRRRFLQLRATRSFQLPLRQRRVQRVTTRGDSSPGAAHRAGATAGSTR